MVWFLGCGGIISTSSDAGVDGSITGACSSNSDCAGGYVCEYPVSGGCSATKQCFPNVACKGGISCACDGTTVTACGGGAPKPIAHTGPCGGADVIAPPPPCGSSLACEMCDVSGYAPTAQGKPIAASGACSTQQIVDFVTACLSPTATSATCQAWQQVDSGACASCVLTPMTSANWGPLACDNQGCTFNAGGCVDITFGQVSKETGAGGSGSCGDLYNAENGCIEYACISCTANDFTTCNNDAMANECKSYVDATNASNGPCGALDAGASRCFPQNNSDFAAFVNVFCGTGP